MKVGAVILAAGSGTRLNDGVPSELPKVLYEIDNRPMVAYTVDLLKSLGITDIVMVIGHKSELVQEKFAGQVDFAVQEQRQGTAHAAKVGEEKLASDITHILIIQGDDSAFYKKETIEKFIKSAKEHKVSFTTVRLSDPKSYGRIIRDSSGNVVEIVEKEWVSAKQEKIKEVNAATYFVDRSWFNQIYPKLRPSKVGKGEIIMNDIIDLTVKASEKVLGFEVPEKEWVGVNTPEELDRANALMKAKNGS